MKHLLSPIKFLNVRSSIISLYTTVHLIFVRCHIRVDTKRIVVNMSDLILEIPYLPAHKTHRDFFFRDFRKKIMTNVF